MLFRSKEWLRPAWVPLLINTLWFVIGRSLAAFYCLALLLPLVTIIGQIR